MHLGLTPWDTADLSVDALCAQAELAESLGYQSFWLPESHFAPRALPDPLLLLAAVAARTRSLRLATSSYLLPLRNPLQAAEQVAVLDQLSGGRVLLGVGRGYAAQTLRAFGVDPAGKRERFEWSLALMRRAWCGEEVSLHEDGSAAVRVEPRPLQQPHPPIWVAAFGPLALQQAGRLGLPYLASPIETLAQLQENYTCFEQALSESGHASLTTRPVMRTVFASTDRSVNKTMVDYLAAIEWPRGLGKRPPSADWAIVGEPALVADRIAQIRESLAATHLIVSGVRLGGVEPHLLRESAERIPALIGA